jgi:hypothetical protein
MENSNLDPEYRTELERLEAELELDDESAKASEQLEMQELMQQAYEVSEDYGKGYVEGFMAGAKFFYVKEAAKWASRQQRYDELNRRWLAH